MTRSSGPSQPDVSGPTPPQPPTRIGFPLPAPATPAQPGSANNLGISLS